MDDAEQNDNAKEGESVAEKSSSPVSDSGSKINEAELKIISQELSVLNQTDESDLFGPECLVIDEHKTPKKGQSRKVKKLKSKSATKNVKEEDFQLWDNEMNEIISENAKKSNLSASNVKEILKHIVTNEQVLAMVKNTMGELTDSSKLSVYEPKLTRSRTKELIEKNEKVPWPISPLKPAPSSEKKIIEAEFKEDESSDEDYKPSWKDELESDEESMLSSHLSDIDSPRILPMSPSCLPSPAVPPPESQETSCDSLIPNLNEADLIASRTRSKLPLTETPLEIIESQFIAPDITTDMYDTECPDDEWKQFLQEFIQPVDNKMNETVEDDNDPEYNIMEDDENKEDGWETRDDNSVKISKVELRELMRDLVDGFEEDFFDETPDPSLGKVENNVSHTYLPPVEQPETIAVSEIQVSLFSPQAYEQLKMQLDKHIQLLAQMYFLASEIPINQYMKSSKLLLFELKRVANIQTNFPSILTHTILDPAISLISNTDTNRLVYSLKSSVHCEFGPKLTKIISQNPVFKYHDLLPVKSYHYIRKDASQKCLFFISEDGLLALGIDQMNVPHPNNALEFVTKFLMPIKSVDQLKLRMKNIRLYHHTTESNPLKYYLIHKKLLPINELNLRSGKSNWNFPLHKEWRKVRSIADIHIQSAKPPRKLTPIRAAIASPTLKSSITPKISPLKQISPILKKYQRMKSKSPTIHKPVLPRISPQMLIQAARKAQKDLTGARRKLLPKLSLNAPSKINNVKKVLKSEISDEKFVSPIIINQSSLVSTAIESEKPKDVDEHPVKSDKGKNTMCGKADDKIIVDSESQSDSEDINEYDKDVDLEALMAASSRICHQRKCKTKQQREIESALALISATNDGDDLHDEKANIYAQSFLNRVYEALKHDLNRYVKFVNLLHDYGKDENANAIRLFHDVRIMLHDQESLVDEFVGFLLPEEAIACDVFAEYLNIKQMRSFLKKLEVHFSKTPQQVQKIIRALNQFQNQSEFSSVNLKTAIIPLLKGQPQLIDEFLSLLPDQPPLDSASQEFEEINFTDDIDQKSDEEFESVNMPNCSEDNYGRKNCPCTCHLDSKDPNYQNRMKHCASCGTKFIGGRVFIQTGKGLKPAKITYHSMPSKEDILDDKCSVKANTSKSVLNKSDKKEKLEEKKNSNKGNGLKSVEHDKIGGAIKEFTEFAVPSAVSSSRKTPVASKKRSATSELPRTFYKKSEISDVVMENTNLPSDISHNLNVSRTDFKSAFQNEKNKNSQAACNILVPNTCKDVQISGTGDQTTKHTLPSANVKTRELNSSKRRKVIPAPKNESDAAQKFFTKSSSITLKLNKISRNGSTFKVISPSDYNVEQVKHEGHKSESNDCDSAKEENAGLKKVCEEDSKSKKTFEEKNSANKRLIRSENKRGNKSEEEIPECKTTSKDSSQNKTVTWSREDDRILLTSCKEKGIGEQIFEEIASKVNKSVSEVQSRFESLMEMLNETSNHDDSSEEFSDN